MLVQELNDIWKVMSCDKTVHILKRQRWNQWIPYLENEWYQRKAIIKAVKPLSQQLPIRW